MPAVRLVIVGLPKSGKTTVFNALTHAEAKTSAYSMGMDDEPNLATVKVPDERLDRLTALFRPKREVPADVQYVDVAGLAKGVSEKGIGGALLGHLAQANALVHVVRVFEDPNVPHPEETVDPLRDIETLQLEFQFNDLAQIEKRLLRLESQIPKVRGAEREGYEREQVVLKRLRETLEVGTPIREVDLDPDDERMLRGFGFLTGKPLLILLNVGEDQMGDVAQSLVAEAAERFQRPGVIVDAIAGQIEMEIGQLDPEDAQVFMEEMNIAESGLDRIIRRSYALLGLISFFTVGPDECRAWTIVKGTMAQQAAGEIHSDIERGFIRAEVVSYDALITAGSMVEAKKAGAHRLEGKQYIVQDGDIIEFLFNV
jgi:GTP-binding protein YchF